MPPGCHLSLGNLVLGRAMHLSEHIQLKCVIFL